MDALFGLSLVSGVVMYSDSEYDENFVRVIKDGAKAKSLVPLVSDEARTFLDKR